ncbi:UDP-N-acetylglucosamine diphosphorylase/glucosamine-1-phosphate N-acetyltransferase [Candidatus Thermokryptus mobilis]|uniref:UDP-N-acetylglucosamine diphosphorylase/glucosamine-1-phosphate N-acetyltransferase n=1 Tax=Candidatus Thermokryptus mobilis TaxID=1643428 RepID=A0A0S4MPV3_9BACT|nr:GlmU family protein [Candidatus Thermokryptus mobilis]CUU00632.1 UDP-N-acetylglucosamine diphosphorylase/glucosamine-1-phosphate N-acetyltransferase [Candidatus Thermokryptus mobilis]
MNICIFEDEKYRKLLPLVYFRPVYELRCGIIPIKDKIIRSFSNPNVILHARDYLTEVLKRDYPNYYVNELPANINQVLFINGRVLADPHFADKFKYNGKDIAYIKGDDIVAFWASGENLEKFKNKFGTPLAKSDFENYEKIEISAKLINYPWDIINNNGEQIVIDFNILTDGKARREGKIYEGVHLLNEHFIHIEEGAKIKPGVVLDAENGPIYIGKNVKILPNAVIEGPAYVGDGSLIKVSAKIYENTSIGPVCKVGGEVEASIIHAFSNKQHEGFIGHSYLGTWVNIGADTNNSDLKNDYGNVKVYVDGELIDSGSMFVGLIMGDHSKSGINLMFNTGTVVGVSCNIYGSGLPPKFVPSFSWGGAEDGFVTYRIDKAIEVAKRVMARRNVQLTEIDEKLFRKIFELTEEERSKAGVK